LALLRDGTWDDAIRASVRDDYRSLPPSFAEGDVVVDVGCHTGGFCELAARRGATVVGYEANRENHALAVMNLAEHPSVTVHLAAVWRSDLDEAAGLLFTPCADPANTGGGSVLFGSTEQHWSALPAEPDGAVASDVLSSHPVPTVALDEVLTAIGPVRFLKFDVEGSEYPILLTSRRLDLVDALAGEYHEFSDTQMAALAPSARVGDDPYRAGLLRRALEDAGFVVTLRRGKQSRLGYFSAQRPA
jgi:FkbM family methyltransferase